MKVKRICLLCGKEFFVKLSIIKKGYGKFCSAKCLFKYRRGKNHPNWKGGKVKRICKQCGKEFDIEPHRIKAGRGIFCSQICQGKWQSKNCIGEKSQGWKGGKTKRTCLQCNKEFLIKPSQIKKGGGKYCSYSCKRKAQKIPKHHTKPERIFEAICKNNNLPYKYTGNGSFWIGNLNPDFVECNGKKMAIEIFGDYWHSPLLRQNIPYNQTYEGRKKILKKYGWKLIMFWESDLKRKDVEQFILSQLKSV